MAHDTPDTVKELQALGERISRARRRTELSQAALAERLGVSRSACGQWERGAAAPSIARLINLAVTLEVSFEWLATGRGDIAFSEPGVREAAPAYAQRREARQAEELLELFGALPAKGREALLALLRALT